ncbi:hypothetical protein K6W59_17105 [Erwinia amylovora]|uniref:hypothetical protein n=1 Tax=Erwinia amylovora TaxID=552 RepID=UPI000C08158D|nr:hypothetical protein [Erwinia amylovora]MBZ2401102.1 hypothetical protein [Erwinia amylovora]MBZ2404517.1 hypothetical protein [Erwinia amylovora]
MFSKILCSLVFVFCSLPSYAQGEVVQGPFKIDGEKAIYFQKESNPDFPLGLYYDSGTKKTQVDKYEVDGDVPNIDTVFFMKVQNVKNVIVLVSWHQLHQAESINGKTYQVYAYKYSGNALPSNDKIKNDPLLSGMDGEFNGDEVHFKYKDATSIKQYIKKKYN